MELPVSGGLNECRKRRFSAEPPYKFKGAILEFFNRAQYKLDYVLGYPSIQNNATLRELAKKAAIEA